MPPATSLLIVRALAAHVSPLRLARMRTALRFRLADTALVFENIENEHNLSACFRTADAFGVQNIHVIERFADANFSPSRGVDKGASKWVTLHRHATTQECLAALEGGGFRVFATDLGSGAVPVAQAVRESLLLDKPPAIVAHRGSMQDSASAVPAALDGEEEEEDGRELRQDVAALAVAEEGKSPSWPLAVKFFNEIAESPPAALASSPRAARPRVAIAFGNEHRGCSKALLSRAHARFYLPQAGFVQSMNLAVATALATQRFATRTPDYEEVAQVANAVMQARERVSLRPIKPIILGGTPSPAAEAATIELPPPPPPLPAAFHGAISSGAACERLSHGERTDILQRWLINHVTGAERILARHGLRPDDF